MRVPKPLTLTPPKACLGQPRRDDLVHARQLAKLGAVLVRVVGRVRIGARARLRVGARAWR